jgi:NAD-dependent DNA ligase
MNEDYIRDTTVVSQVKKRVREVPHSYDMCGTLDKAKYVLNYDAQCAGAYVDRTVNILERDFFEANIRSGNINPNFLNVLVSLKYDGVSIEATIVDDKIVRACSRGDTGANKATDYTEVFEGYTFPRATQAGLKTNGEIGIKFEAILTLDAYKVLRDEYGKNYANLRNGVAGLLNGLDARRFRDFLTLVPLESSLTVDRISEVEFLNKYYSRGIDFRCEYFAGPYAEVLFKIKKYVEEAEALREYMKFIYDGIVVELVNPVIRQNLGKNGSIPNYAIAVKFNPRKRDNTFL